MTKFDFYLGISLVCGAIAGSATYMYFIALMMALIVIFGNIVKDFRNFKNMKKENEND